MKRYHADGPRVTGRRRGQAVGSFLVEPRGGELWYP